jgi:hypothetical protein
VAAVAAPNITAATASFLETFANPLIFVIFATFIKTA